MTVFWNFPLDRDSDATEKISGFSPQCSSKNVKFKIEIFMEEFEFAVAEELKFGHWAK